MERGRPETEPAEIPAALRRLIAEIRQEFGAAVSVETVRDRWDPSRLNALIRPSSMPDSAAVFVQDADDVFWVLAGGWELNTEEVVAPPGEHYRMARDEVLRIGRFGLLRVRDRGWRRLLRPRGRLVVPSSEQEARELFSDSDMSAAYEIHPWNGRDVRDRQDRNGEHRCT